MSALTYRSGPTQLVRVAADPAHAIRPGMLLGLAGGLARPASATPWDEDLAGTREAFAQTFLGVAHSASPAGEGGPVSVDLGPGGVYAPALEPGGCAFGQPLAPADDGGTLSDVRVAAVADPGEAIGRAVEAADPAAAAVRAAFASAFCTASSHVRAAVG